MRYILLSGAARPLGANAEAVLFAAARDDHLTTLIRPALAQGKWVVCDRFADSTRIYQGVAGDVDPMAIRAMERIIVGDTKPDLTFILDVPAKEGMRRADKRRGDGGADRFEGEALAFHERLRDGFLTLAANEPDRCVLIDATTSKEEVADQIWRVVQKKLDPATAPIQFEDEARLSPAADSDDGAIPHPRATSELFGHAEAEQTLLDAYRGGRIPHAWLIGGETRHRQGDAGLPHGALRAGLSRSGDASGAEGQIARRPGRSSGGAAHRRAGAQRSPGAGARHQRKDRQALHRDPRRGCPAHRAVLRLDRRRGRLAGRHRRSAGRPQQGRRERAAQGAGGAAAARAAAAGQPCARPRAADHPLALPDLDPAPARRRGHRARDGRGDGRGRPAPTRSAPPPTPPTARSGAR